MKYFALYHHKTSFEEIDEAELFRLLSAVGPVVPSILRLIRGSTVITADAQIYGIIL